MCMAQQQPSGGGQVNTGAAALTGAASGATMGAVAGPWGAAAGAVAGAAIGIVGSRAANKSAKNAEENRRLAQELQISETRKRATNDYLNTLRIQNVQVGQEHAAVAEKSIDVRNQTDTAIGTAVASAAERGVGGRTLAQIVSDFHMQNDKEIGRLNINQQMKDTQHGEVTKAANTEYYNHVTSQQSYAKKAVAPVDYFSPVFKLAGDLGKIAMASGAGQTGGTIPSDSGVTTTPKVDYSSGFSTDTLDG